MTRPAWRASLYAPIKRGLDVVLSAVMIVLCAPILAIAAIAIVRDDGRPILFRQKRAGRHGQPFEILKFRSMVTDAEERGSYQTADGDPRITRAGAWLRKTSIDELPQLLNVLTGDMSLIGPRPDTLAQRANYTEAEWQKRSTVRPGITGLAQVLHKKTATPKSRIELDLEYVDRFGPWCDLVIAARTLWTVINLRNS